jgi:transcriptional regulator with PAS, ATPase and Fis domain
VLAENAVAAIHVLPEGPVTIGRGNANTIVIDDDSISRRHAVLHVGDALLIEDLGSSNGTKVRELPLRPHKPRALAINELIVFGSVSVIVQARFAPAQTSQITTQDYFLSRVEEECRRSERNGGQFGVVGVRVTGDPETIAQTLISTLRQSDVLARFRDDLFALLATEATRDHAEEAARRLVAALQAAGASASYVVAHYPADARSAYALLSQINDQPDEDTREDLVIEEPAMRDLYHVAKQIAASDLSVLVLGETGVGKEKLSRFLHDASPRVAKPFVAINCAAINDSLLESELFGHERGAFTGAATSKPGLLESADGGTVFLDEIGDMSLAIQAKLLRVLEDREVRRVGGLKSKTIDVRFVAATHVDLEEAVAENRFREDLYFRLSAATLVIPPLRERPREIEILAKRFAGSARTGRRRLKFTPDALNLLCSYSWPGNIRELRNVIERAVVLCTDDVITADQLPVDKIRGTYTRPATATPQPTRRLRGEEERAAILLALEQAEGNQSRAASLLGYSRRTLINRLEQYNLPRPRKSSKDSERE